MSPVKEGGNGKEHPPSSSIDLGYLLFDSLVHHLIEKGVLTKNDALSVVQTVAEVVRGQTATPEVDHSLGRLKSLYLSYDALASGTAHAVHDAHNVRELRPPLHRNMPRFPADD